MYVDSEEFKDIEFDYFKDGVIISAKEHLFYDIQKGVYVEDECEGWGNEARECMRNKQFYVYDMLDKLHRYSNINPNDVEKASPHILNCLKHMIVADVDGDDILKSLKAVGYDIKGWKLTRLYLGGWSITNSDGEATVSDFIEMLHAQGKTE